MDGCAALGRQILHNGFLSCHMPAGKLLRLLDWEFTINRYWQAGDIVRSGKFYVPKFYIETPKGAICPFYYYVTEDLCNFTRLKQTRL